MKPTDYILTNNDNKTFPFGVEIYTIYQSRIVGMDYEGFATISEAIKFVEQTDLPLRKQR